jgi:hypothetical protein
LNRVAMNRDAKIILAHTSGKTFREVGKDFGLVPDRVAQIFWKAIHLWQARWLYQQRDSNPEDVWLETEQWRSIEVGGIPTSRKALNKYLRLKRLQGRRRIAASYRKRLGMPDLERTRLEALLRAANAVREE